MNRNTLLDAALIGHRRDGRPIYLAAGGSEENESVEKPEGQQQSDNDGYKPPQTQADLDRIVQARVRRAEERFSDYEDLKAKAAEADRLRSENATEAEKAVEAARAEERQAAIPRVVRAEFRAAAKGVLTDEQLTSLLEDLDLSKYADSKGDPKGEKIANKVNAFAPATTGASTTTSSRTLGQGAHTPRAGGRRSGGSVADVMAERRAAREAVK